MTNSRNHQGSERTQVRPSPAGQRPSSKRLSIDETWDDEDERESVDDLDDTSWMRTRMSSF